jgi:hypothetical protein
MARRHFKGNAIATHLASPITDSANTFTIDNPTGWPTGGANGPFTAILDADLPSEEHVLVANQAAGVCTGVTRGIGDTVGVAHSVGPDGTVFHGVCKLDYDEANQHINDTAQDHHTQYLNTARHAGILHSQAMLDVNSVGAAQIISDAVTQSELAPLAVGTPELIDASVTLAKLAGNSVDSSKIVDLSIVAGDIANSTITAGKLAVNTLTANEIAAGAITASELGNGAVAETADIVDGIITLAKFASEAGTNYGGAGAGAVGPWTNTILGTGGLTYARYYKLGRLVIVFAGIQLGTGGDFSGPMALNLPFNAASISGFGGSDAAVGGFVATRAWNQLTSVRVSGTGVISTTQALNFVAAFQASTWSFDQPFDWSDAGSGSKLQLLAVYEAA